MDFVLKALWTNFYISHFGPVSILVLLDFVLKEKCQPISIARTMLFQSLFYWILFLRSKTFRRRNGKKEVSILVLLDFVLKAEEEIKEKDLETQMFQSLFYWILFLRPYSLECLSSVLVGFNPCFIGFCS